MLIDRELEGPNIYLILKRTLTVHDKDVKNCSNNNKLIIPNCMYCDFIC